MPNVVAHMMIAEAVTPVRNYNYFLCSALPDFLGMARDLRGSTTTLKDLKQNDLLVDGINLHIATDNVYDQLPETRQLVSQARTDFDKIELPKGAARACADIGTEILLDGVLMEEAKLSVYNIVKKRVNDENQVLKSIKDQDLVQLILAYFADDRPNRYKDAEAVAGMLHYRFGHRKRQRLAFEEDRLPDVAEVLLKQQKRLKQTGKLLVKMTIEGLISAHLSV